MFLLFRNLEQAAYLVFGISLLCLIASMLLSLVEIN
jgi:hypothetical protein